jgi:hypothetical protein
VFTNTDPPPKSERHVTFQTRFFWAWYEFTVVPKMPFWPEVIRIVTKYGPVAIAMPYIGYARRAFRNEHALVPIIFYHFVRHSESDNGSPANDFFNDRPHVRKPWSVSICRETRTADHGIKFSLRSGLHLSKGYHRKHPPH